MNLSIPATENLFDYYQRMCGFDFAKDFINELDIAQLKGGRLPEKEFWELQNAGNTSAFDTWKKENDTILLNGSLPMQLLYLKYLEQQIPKVSIRRPDKAVLLKQRDEYIETHHNIPNFYYDNPREGALPVSLMEVYLNFVDKFYSELIATVSQAIGSLKIITSKEIKALPPEYSANNITTDEVIEDDARIPISREKKQQLIKDFLRLTMGKGILSEEDVLFWLRADFQGFIPVPNNNRVLHPNTEKGIMMRFVKQVFDKYGSQNRNRIILYRDMLHRRISLYNDPSDVQIIHDHFSDKEPKKFPAFLRF